MQEQLKAMQGADRRWDNLILICFVIICYEIAQALTIFSMVTLQRAWSDTLFLCMQRLRYAVIVASLMGMIRRNDGTSAAFGIRIACLFLVMGGWIWTM